MLFRSTLSQHQINQIKWSEAINRGSDALTNLIRKGKQALNTGWEICSDFVGKKKDYNISVKDYLDIDFSQIFSSYNNTNNNNRISRGDL